MGETPTPIAPCKKGFDFSKLSHVLKVPGEWQLRDFRRPASTWVEFADATSIRVHTCGNQMLKALKRQTASRIELKKKQGNQLRILRLATSDYTRQPSGIVSKYAYLENHKQKSPRVEGFFVE
jgi:hypothetical protein